jgi:uncharacterized membrane protein YciS (DUF1049 family)
MNYLLLLITIPLTLFAVAFAVANTHDVTVHFEPFLKATLVEPLGTVALGMMGAGFFFGALFVWMYTHRLRFRHWRQSRHVARLEKELDVLQKKGSA